jgi:hypothetical protein
MMASDNESHTGGEACHHEDQEWDAQRDNFLRYYKDEKKTLKAATQCMIANHNFYATPRQWERKISSWGITKYTPRAERMQQIENQGRTLIEVAQGGRRPRKYSNNLEVDDDRNIRRFARRALSRSPSSQRARSRSSSGGQQSPCLSPRPEILMDDLVVNERVHDLDVSVFWQHSNPSSVPAVLANQPTDNPQVHAMVMQNPQTGERHRELIFDFPAQQENGSSTLADSMLHNPTPYEPFPSYTNGMNANVDLGTNTDLSNMQQGLNGGVGFMAQPVDAMDISPTHTQEMAPGWHGREAMSLGDANVSFGSSITPLHQVFEQPLLTPVQSNEFKPIMMPEDVMGGLPMVLISPDASSPSSHDAPPAVGAPIAFTPVPNQNDLNLTDPYPDFSQHVDDYSLAVQTTFQSYVTSARSREETVRDLERYKALFSQRMNRTLDSLVMSHQRSVRIGQETNRKLKQRIEALESRGMAILT